MPRGDTARPLISVIVKCYNEEKNIGRCLESILAVTAGYHAEIIVADAKSADRTAAIAAGFPVRVVQFENGADRNCGATAQLGWQFATGEHVLLVDGDMEVMPEFLPAAFAAFAADPTLGAVGGRLIEMSEALEFQERLRSKRLQPARDVPCVTGCGLYRAAAIRATGYFMDRNLHCYEEIDLGGRLRAAGWRLRLLDVDCVRHHGHSVVALWLLLRRWRSHTLDGYGEYLRVAWNSPRRREALWICRFALVTIGWWAALCLLALAAPWVPALGLVALLLALLPITALLLRKRRFDRAVYALAMWQLAGASLIRGALARRIEPRTPFRSTILHEPAVTPAEEMRR
jgi:glycosyltransferase involved in cell wall biosynthesis